MDASQAATLAMGVVVDVAILWVALNVRAIWKHDRHPCMCGCRKNQHVSALDWDSDYGDPQHVGANYRIPGSCRKCACRYYIPERGAA